MAESAPKPAAKSNVPPPAGPAPTPAGASTQQQAAAPQASSGAAIVKKLESQLVSMNFMLKNTQSEVIKLQKNISRNQSKQDELEREISSLKQQLTGFYPSKDLNSRFNSILVLSIIASVLINSLVYVFILKPSNTSSGPIRIQSSAPVELEESPATTESADANSN